MTAFDPLADQDDTWRDACGATSPACGGGRRARL